MLESAMARKAHAGRVGDTTLFELTVQTIGPAGTSECCTIVGALVGGTLDQAGPLTLRALE